MLSYKFDCLNDDYEVSQVMFGQASDRKACGVVYKMIQEGAILQLYDMRAIVDCCTNNVNRFEGKLADQVIPRLQWVYLAQAIGEDNPFTAIAGSEIFSLEMSKTEVSAIIKYCVIDW